MITCGVYVHCLHHELGCENGSAAPNCASYFRTRDVLEAANAEPLATSSATDAIHWLWNAGDHPHEQPLCESLSHDFRFRDGDDSRDPSSRTYVALDAELAAEQRDPFLHAG